MFTDEQAWQQAYATATKALNIPADTDLELLYAEHFTRLPISQTFDSISYTICGTAYTNYELMELVEKLSADGNYYAYVFDSGEQLIGVLEVTDSFIRGLPQNKPA